MNALGFACWPKLLPFRPANLAAGERVLPIPGHTFRGVAQWFTLPIATGRLCSLSMPGPWTVRGIVAPNDLIASALPIARQLFGDTPFPRVPDIELDQRPLCARRLLFPRARLRP